MHRLAVCLFVCLVASGHVVLAQQDLQIAVAGGLLGQMDGFFEFPADPAELPPPSTPPVPVRPSAYGGLEALRRWAESGPSDILLISGDNLPMDIGNIIGGHRTDPFVDHLNDFSRVFSSEARSRYASDTRKRVLAVSLGGDDIVRALRRASGEAFATWLTRQHVPFLASNVVIKRTAPKLNTIHGGGLTLHVDESASVEWTGELEVSHPCSAGKPAFVLESDAGRETIEVTKPKGEGTGTCHVTIAIARRLKPGRVYRLSDGTATLTFETHRALTPRDGGLPVIAPVDSRHPLIVSFVDPSTADLLGKRKRSWDCPRPDRQDAKCELLVLGPTDTLQALLNMTASTTAPPLVALISGLTDATTSEVLANFPPVRVVALRPDSNLLGLAAEAREADATNPQAFAGESRYYGLLRGNLAPPFAPPPPPLSAAPEPPATAAAILMRPEWVAEAVVVTTIAQTISPTVRDITTITSQVSDLPGYVLCWKEQNGDLSYYLRDRPDIRLRQTPPYPVGEPSESFDTDRRFPQGDLWVDWTQFAAVALDVMRVRARAEIALAPDTIVDDDVTDWLAYVRDDAKRPLNWMSRLVLERALFHADHYVRVVVQGKELVGTVNKILAQHVETGVTFCLAGVDNHTCDVAKLDDKHLLVNGRHLDADHYYAIAVFQSVADRHGLAYDVDDVHDLVEDFDRRFRRERALPSTAGCADDRGTHTTAPGPTRSLAERLEEARERPQQYFELSVGSVDLAVNNTTFSEEGAPLLPQAIEGASPKDYWRLAAKAAADAGLWDTRRYAVRGVGSIDYQQETVADNTSIDRDEFKVGARGDRKWRLGDTTARLFTGYFVEGGLNGRDKTVTAARIIENVADPADATQTIASVTFTGPDLTYLTERRLYRYASLGVEAEGWKVTSWATFKRLVTEFHFLGRSEHELRGVAIDGDPRPIATFLRNGAARVVRDYFTERRLQPTTANQIVLDYTALDQRRWETTVHTEHAVAKIDGKDVIIENELRARKYSVSDPVAYSLRWSVQDTLQVKIPIWSRIAATFGASYHTVELEALERNLEVIRFTAGFTLPFFAKHATGLFAR